MLGKAKRVDMASAKERESFKEMTASFDCEVSQKRARFIKTGFISLSRCRRETSRAVPPRTPGMFVCANRFVLSNEDLWFIGRSSAPDFASAVFPIPRS